MARLSLLRAEPKGNRVCATLLGEAQHVNACESRTSDLKPGDLLLGRLKPGYNRVEDRQQY